MANLPFQAHPRVLTTVGETLADGSILELVTSTTPGLLALLSRRAGHTRIASQLEHSGCLYKPPNLDEAIVRSIRFPHDARSYSSTRKLLCRIRELFERHAGLPQPEAALITAWAASSWFADCLSSPPTLLISGPDLDHAIRLFRLLHCLCRRPVLLGDFSRSAFLALAPLGTTFLVNQPGLSPKIRALWSTSNFRGVYVFGNGRISSVASSKAVFLGMDDAQGDEGVHVALPPARFDLPSLGEQQQSEIAEEIQPQLLMYRLRNLDEVRDFSPSRLGSTFLGTEAGRSLAASVLGETEIIDSIAPLLLRLQQEKIAHRGCDVHLVMIEVGWAPSHGDREISISRLTELTNTLLRSRGEILEYSSAEIGWKLRNFGFRHHRNGHGMVLQFSHENRFLIHQLAARWNLNLRPVAACVLCSAREVVAAKGVM